MHFLLVALLLLTLVAAASDININNNIDIEQINQNTFSHLCSKYFSISFPSADHVREILPKLNSRHLFEDSARCVWKLLKYISHFSSYVRLALPGSHEPVYNGCKELATYTQNNARSLFEEAARRSILERQNGGACLEIIRTLSSFTVLYFTLRIFRLHAFLREAIKATFTIIMAASSAVFETASTIIIGFPTSTSRWLHQGLVRTPELALEVLNHGNNRAYLAPTRVPRFTQCFIGPMLAHPRLPRKFHAHLASLTQDYFTNEYANEYAGYLLRAHSRYTSFEFSLPEQLVAKHYSPKATEHLLFTATVHLIFKSFLTTVSLQRVDAKDFLQFNRLPANGNRNASYADQFVALIAIVFAAMSISNKDSNCITTDTIVELSADTPLEQALPAIQPLRIVKLAAPEPRILPWTERAHPEVLQIPRRRPLRRDNRTDVDKAVDELNIPLCAQTPAANTTDATIEDPLAKPQNIAPPSFAHFHQFTAEEKELDELRTSLAGPPTQPLCIARRQQPTQPETLPELPANNPRGLSMRRRRRREPIPTRPVPTEKQTATAPELPQAPPTTNPYPLSMRRHRRREPIPTRPHSTNATSTGTDYDPTAGLHQQLEPRRNSAPLTFEYINARIQYELKHK